jgi:GntR family transcriptional regulator/MocR family aminotransferase
MPIEWSGLSPELMVPLDREAAEPLRNQLEGHLRTAIRSGRLRLGERLPSSREFARGLGVSRGLVQDCYNQLQAEGYLSTRVGSATRVAAGAPAAEPPRPGPAAPEPARPAVDFRAGTPDLASFPRGDWAWAVRESCRAAPTAMFDYGDARGVPFLREILAGYLRRLRGAAADPENLVVCGGFAQGLVLVLRALRGLGITRVGFEDPGYADTASSCRPADVQAVPVPVDERGVDVGALDATGVRAVLLSPAHQWPTGVVLAPERRQALVEWAARCDAVIIEDDYDAEFRYDREPVGALQGLAPDRVVALGTVSKSLAPAVRLGWAVCPPALAGRIAEQKEEHDRGSPSLDQYALGVLIESGRYDRHLRRMRAVYAARRTALVEALAEHAPTVGVTGLAAGFHAVAHLPEGVGEPAVVASARARSVGLYGMSRQRADHSVLPPQLVMGFGNLTERAVRSGIATVGDLLRGEA